MAVNHWADPWDEYVPPTSTEHIIQGKMLEFTMSVREFSSGPEDPDEIKYQLCAGLLEHVLENKLVEFTKQNDIGTGCIHYRARMFVTPDDNVRIIRIANQKR
jgi:hypothetical protein